MARFVLSAFADEAGSSLKEQITALRENNIDFIEPRLIDGKGILKCTEEELAEIKKELDSNGIRVNSLGSPIGKFPIDDDFDTHLVDFEKALRTCEILGTTNMRVFSFYVEQSALKEKRDEVIARLNKMVEIAKPRGIDLCHENESKIYGQMPSEVADILNSVPGMYGVFDAANYRMNDADTVEGMKSTLINLKYLHIKDAAYKSQTIVPAGEGEGMVAYAIEQANEATDEVVYLTLEPHLHIFDAYKDIDQHELRGKYSFKTNREAFDFAANTLKSLLKKLGYEPNENNEWVKTVKKVRFGIVGCGNIGSKHAKNLDEGLVYNATLTAVCDTNPKKLEAFEKMYGDKIKYYGTAEEMYASGECDCVIICVPHYDHPALAMKAQDAGLHCIVEKPAGVYTLQAQEMIDHANKSDKILGIMFNQRTNPAFIKMREMIRDGAIGEIKRTNWIITDWYRTQHYYNTGEWRATWVGEGGGVLYNQSPHQLDLFQWIVGMMPTKVHAFCHFGKWHDIEVEDDVTCYCEYPNGATGVFITTTADAPGTNRFEVTGTRGTLIFENNTLYYTALEVDEREHCYTAKGMIAPPKRSTVVVPLYGENSQHAGICRNVAAAILGLEELYAPASDGICGVELANAMLLSGWLGEDVSLPIDGEKFYEELKKRIATSKPRECADNDSIGFIKA